MTHNQKILLSLLVLLIAALLLAACTSSADEGCRRIKITTCSKFEDGQLADSYTLEGSSCRTCRWGYAQSCHDGCE